MNLTEECFQKYPLDFVGDDQWIQYGIHEELRSKAFPAMRTKNGTLPAGSQWTRNPIPACKGYTGGANMICTGPQFPAPLPCGQFGCVYGFGKHGLGEQMFKFSIVDKVQVPAHLQPGKYVLSFRYDCEQTPQVWNSCSDIEIQAGDVLV